MDECNKSSRFCYVCGKYTVDSVKKNLTNHLIEAYQLYYGKQVLKNVWWAPTSACENCYRSLLLWMQGKKSSMPFGTPMIWLQPENHDIQKCYFCTYYTVGCSRRTLKNIEYKSFSHAIVTAKHDVNIPIPLLPDLRSDSTDFQDCPDSSPTYMPSEITITNQPQLITQDKFNDLVRDLRITKTDSEILGSRLKQWNLLAPEVSIL